MASYRLLTICIIYISLFSSVFACTWVLIAIAYWIGPVDKAATLGPLPTEADVLFAQGEILFPLRKGAMWQYEVYLDDIQGTDATLVVDGIRTTPEGLVASCSFFSSIDGRGEFEYLSNKSGLYEDTYKGRLLLLPYPASVGRQWTQSIRLSMDSMETFPTTYAIERQVKVTVPAGTFMSVEVHQRTPASQDDFNEQSIVWYAPGIGVIRQHTMWLSKSNKNYSLKMEKRLKTFRMPTQR